MRKLTTEEFKEQIKDYSVKLLGEYKGAHTKTLFKCKKCDYEWLVRPNNIKKGQNCPNCVGKKRMTSNDFKKFLITKNIILVGEYKNTGMKTTFQCDICGYIWQTVPSSIKRGRGCSKCKNKYSPSTEEFKEQIKDYSVELLGEYENAHTKTLFKCKKCDYEWNTRPNDVKSGYGCPKCFKRKTHYQKYHNKETILYYIYFPNKNVYKIGLTQSSVKKRYKSDKEKYIILSQKRFKDGYKAYLKEQDIIQKFKRHRYKGNDFLKAGNSELFDVNILTQIPNKGNQYGV